MSLELLTGDLVKDGEEPTLLQYIDEIDFVIKPMLRLGFEYRRNVDEGGEAFSDNAFSLIWVAFEQWEKITKEFLEHLRRAHGVELKAA